MATETEIVQEIGSNYEAKYGFSNPDAAGDYFFKSGRGISHEIQGVYTGFGRAH